MQVWIDQNWMNFQKNIARKHISVHDKNIDDKNEHLKTFIELFFVFLTSFWKKNSNFLLKSDTKQQT